jgi:hypothetical protein
VSCRCRKIWWPPPHVVVFNGISDRRFQRFGKVQTGQGGVTVAICLISQQSAIVLVLCVVFSQILAVAEGKLFHRIHRRFLLNFLVCFVVVTAYTSGLTLFEKSWVWRILPKLNGTVVALDFSKVPRATNWPPSAPGWGQLSGPLLPIVLRRSCLNRHSSLQFLFCVREGGKGQTIGR